MQQKKCAQKKCAQKKCAQKKCAQKKWGITIAFTFQIPTGRPKARQKLAARRVPNVTNIPWKSMRFCVCSGTKTASTNSIMYLLFLYFSYLILNPKRVRKIKKTRLKIDSIPHADTHKYAFPNIVSITPPHLRRGISNRKNTFQKKTFVTSTPYCCPSNGGSGWVV